MTSYSAYIFQGPADKRRNPEEYRVELMQLPSFLKLHSWTTQHWISSSTVQAKVDGLWLFPADRWTGCAQQIVHIMDWLHSSTALHQATSSHDLCFLPFRKTDVQRRSPSHVMAWSLFLHPHPNVLDLATKAHYALDASVCERVCGQIKASSV